MDPLQVTDAAGVAGSGGGLKLASPLLTATAFRASVPPSDQMVVD